MNLVFNQNGNKAFIKSDSGDLSVDNLSQLQEILKAENVQEQLQLYYDRDVKRLEELNARNFKINNATTGTLMGSIGIAGILTVANSCNVIDSDFARGIQLTAAAVGGTVTLVNQTVLSRRREKLGLIECINYEKEKLEDLETKIGILVESSTIVEGEGSTLVDSRKELCQLDDVLNFIFYYGANKKKVQKMYQRCELISFLEKQGVRSMSIIAEIEDYLFRELNNTKMCDEVMLKK